MEYSSDSQSRSLTTNGLNDAIEQIVSVFHQIEDQYDGVLVASHSLSSSPTHVVRDSKLVEFSINYLANFKRIVHADIDHHCDESSEALANLSYQLQQNNFFPRIFQYLSYFPLDIRKDFGFISTSLIRKNAGDIVTYFQQHGDIIETLLSALIRAETALFAGQILREASKYPYLAYQMFLSSHFWHFFEHYLHSTNFDIASESFALIKELLTSPHLREVQDGFFETNGDVFIVQYQLLLASENLLTRRRSLKLLSELLLDRNNYNLMMKFISSKDNLKTIMNLLRHKSSQITFEAFHVFKIFVANPKKTKEVGIILYNNRNKLIPFLQQFHHDKTDPTFLEEKQLLVSNLDSMEDPDPDRTVVSSSYSSNDSSAQQLPPSIGGEHDAHHMSFSHSVSATNSPRTSFSGNPSTGAASSSSSALLRKHLRPRSGSHTSSQRNSLSRTSSPSTSALSMVTNSGHIDVSAVATTPNSTQNTTQNNTQNNTQTTATSSNINQHQDMQAPIDSTTKHLHHEQSHRQLLALRQQQQQQRRHERHVAEDDASQHHHGTTIDEQPVLKPPQPPQPVPNEEAARPLSTSSASSASSCHSRQSGVMPLSESFRSAMHLDPLSLSTSNPHTRTGTTDDGDEDGSGAGYHSLSLSGGLSSSFPTPLSAHHPSSSSSATLLSQQQQHQQQSNTDSTTGTGGPPAYSPTPSPAYYLHYRNLHKQATQTNHASSHASSLPTWSLSSTEPSPAATSMLTSTHSHVSSSSSISMSLDVSDLSQQGISLSLEKGRDAGGECSHNESNPDIARRILTARSASWNETS